MKEQRFVTQRKKFFLPVFMLSVFLAFASCRNEGNERQDRQMDLDRTNDTVATRQVEPRVFRGDISGVNTQANEGSEVTGTVELRVEGSLMRIVVNAEGLAGEMMHMQYLQTSENGTTNCPGADADINQDGVIDDNEITNRDRGVYRIPLHMGPSTLQMDADSYPFTNINGTMQFNRTISLDSLRTAVRQEYGIQELDFTDFTYVVQGIAETQNMPESVESGTGLARNATIPVGCAKLEEN